MTDRPPLWPIPDPSWRARLFCVTKFSDKTVPFGDARLDLAYDRSTPPVLPRRWRRLERGGHEQLTLLIVGRLPWCPPFPEGHPVRVTADSATSDGGGGPSTRRALPLELLQVDSAALLDPPTRPIVPALETWTLTVRQETGTATITGLLADLALLAAVARWAPPRALLEHEHAGTVDGWRLRRQRGDDDAGPSPAIPAPDRES